MMEKSIDFKGLIIELSPGINVFLGLNGIGKTWILERIAEKNEKTCPVSFFRESIDENLNLVFPKNGLLIWDDCGSKIHPQGIRQAVSTILRLYREGGQVCLSTNNYIVLAEFNLQRKKGDQIQYHSLFKKRGEIKCNSVEDYYEIEPSEIEDVFLDLYERDISRDVRLDDDE